MVLVLTIGLSLAPYIVGVVMDVFAVSVHSATGWDLGVGFVENSLGMWPGGEVIAAIMFHTSVFDHGAHQRPVPGVPGDRTARPRAPAPRE